MKKLVFTIMISLSAIFLMIPGASALEKDLTMQDSYSELVSGKNYLYYELDGDDYLAVMDSGVYLNANCGSDDLDSETYNVLWASTNSFDHFSVYKYEDGSWVLDNSSYEINEFPESFNGQDYTINLSYSYPINQFTFKDGNYDLYNIASSNDTNLLLSWGNGSSSGSNPSPSEPNTSDSMSITGVFSSTNSIILGIASGGIAFLNTMWTTSFGKVIILLGLAGTMIAFGKGITKGVNKYRIFKRKHMWF